MEFTGKNDIDVPIDHLFEMVTNFETFERSALRRGAEVTRIDDLIKPGIGAHWQIGFNFRGKQRDVDLQVVGFERPNELTLHAKATGLSSDIKIELVPLSRTRTRLQFWSGLSASSLSARLLLQSLKLARSNLSAKLNKRLSKLGREMEERYAKQS